jgi:hypothetical protein
MLKNIALAAFGVIIFASAALLLSAALRHDANAAEAPQGAQLPTDQDEPIQHRVLPGETLYSISRAYFGDASRWQTIAAANGLSAPQSLKAGSILLVPRQPTRAVEALSAKPKLPLPGAPLIATGEPGAELLTRLELTPTGATQRSFAAISQRDGILTIRLLADTGRGETELYRTEINATATRFGRAWLGSAADAADGASRAIHTSWIRPGGEPLTRTFSVIGGKLALTEETADSPLALFRDSTGG